ncbi:uncharacterized protein [Procambarus clarkii]|uniref:uncharacterized protein isoform X2 n=1 Tax=Procambarus clarkii TaxID=6728 RepID=UPI00374467C2
MISLNQMENRGYQKEGHCSTSDPDQSIYPAAPFTHQVDLSHPRATCTCEENQNTCTCGSSSPAKPKSKVELLTWVQPKGWLLLALGLAFVAWCAIFFTLLNLDMI